MVEQKKPEPKTETFKGPELKDPPAPPAAPAGKMHVSIYLKARGVPVWHVEGKVAFAKCKKMEFASEKDFDELFKKY